MELLESDDPKSKLLKKTALQRQALEDEARLLSERTEKTITTALIIGGALLTTYFLVRQFSGSDNKPKSKAKKLKIVTQNDDSDHTIEPETHVPGVVAQIGTALASQATVFLLTLAKEKLFEFLESQKKTSNDERS
jgi:hypothetical protein